MTYYLVHSYLISSAFPVMCFCLSFMEFFTSLPSGECSKDRSTCSVCHYCT